ncbi:hypothetical protein [Bifidobacterium pullorum]|uniref:hypothetical protein n=1 Tax=Bifidobacterium pullorum TaxID=78448 RepID=UPI00242C4FE0|nr:hypothetical protein [Bifidobacterium pullorum]
MKSEIGTMPAPVVIPKSMEQVERDHQGLCDLIRRDVRRIVAEELDRRGLVDRGTNPVSTEEFIRRNPELHGLVRDAVRDALHGIGKRGDRPGRVAGSGVGLGVVRGIYWIAFHALTSLLCVACTILALKAFLEGDE